MTEPKDVPSEARRELARRLGLFDAVMMMVGIVIGSGIFLTTGIIAKSLPSPALILLVWAVGGLIALAGALTFAELGAAMPEAGGQYVYLREAYGPMAGFLFGWILFFVSMSGAIAAGAVGFSEYFSSFFPFLSTQNKIFFLTFEVFRHPLTISVSMGQGVAVGIILLFSAINYIGVGLGKTIQNIITSIKIILIAGFVIAGLALGKGGKVDFSLHGGQDPVSFGRLLVGFGIALIAVSWAYDGWHNVNYIAGEIRNPKRNLPLALVLGISVIISLYLLVNLVYIIALPMNEMRGAVRIAEKATHALFGGTPAGFVSAAVIISTLGSLNGAIFVGARVYYAMAKDRIFFRKTATVHPRFQTPASAILFQAVWSCVIAVSGTYEQILTYVTFINIVFWLAGASAIFVLRRKRPDLPRSYKTWGYPVVPLLFMITLTGILINTLIKRPGESLIGTGLMLIGIPVFLYWRRKR